MRVLVDLSSHIGALGGGTPPFLLQVDNAKDLGVQVPLNGKYAIPVAEGSKITIDSNSYALPVDGGDLYSQVYANLLAQYPMYDFIYFNPLLRATEDIGQLDLTTTFKDNAVAPPHYYPSRMQIGRADPVAELGQAPNTTAILPLNDKVSPSRPGMMMTNKIDITPYTGEAGADDFMVYWKLYGFSTSDDVAGGEVGSVVGVNTPAIRSIEEVNQEPVDFEVYLSIDNGDNWFQVYRLQQIAFCCRATEVRLAFLNKSSTKRYLATYAIMF